MNISGLHKVNGRYHRETGEMRVPGHCEKYVHPEWGPTEYCANKDSVPPECPILEPDYVMVVNEECKPLCLTEPETKERLSMAATVYCLQAGPNIGEVWNKINFQYTHMLCSSGVYVGITPKPTKPDHGFQIGDWVETDDPQYPLHCATYTYDFAIVVESDPLTLKSRSGDMTWVNRKDKLRKIDLDKIHNLLKGEPS